MLGIKQLLYFMKFSVRPKTSATKPGIDGKTIYGTYNSIDDYVKHQNRIHKWFKYGFLTIILRIGMWLSRTILSNYYVTPDKINHDKLYDQLRLFSDSFEKGLSDWHYGYHCSNTLSRTTPIDDRYCVHMTRFMRDIILTVCQNDTAYYDLLQKIMFQITINENNSNLNNKGTIEQIMYTSKSVMDTRYYIATESLDKGIVLAKIDIDKIKQVFS